MTSKMALKDIRQFDTMSKEHDFEYEIIDKELRVLEIIKKRKCNVADFILDNPTWEEIQELDYWFKETPTKKEFDLLKEVLL